MKIKHLHHFQKHQKIIILWLKFIYVNCIKILKKPFIGIKNRQKMEINLHNFI
ncbi:hypothetical protein GLOIN_2v1666255 [Rhizophagus irregularis DAOM 181602=DAOM 197198]|uniref:Uncharacterized protein n=1 Tax=Rhizophagus irregularis (strain DAOM 181602 / DAOM 197198 / MUCL 43194) TaxID=747089 RepID=A0A2P4PJC5_RHIID|nr:hypothetical protein GLOIN_2v1666255 [Rhizophagus irregularis DAOM 181602=DAOM 197198]POG65483.1 hypothetical protein GLOIN_2v1666255 [Rhizophagus irregularis DAOM 181602=DAOM 197198]|eukprot:XP_025172349.1 hypothetical protein GLOIN_2v1666255 [Rhizophagus irregularis DAOM 181602=DAOM 197198]